MLLFINFNGPGVVYAGDETSTFELDSNGGQSWVVSREQALDYLTCGWRLALWANPCTNIIEHAAPEYPPVREQEPDEDPYFSPELELHWTISRAQPLIAAPRKVRARRAHSRRRGYSRSRDRYLAIEAGYADFEDAAAAAEYEHDQAVYEER